MKFIYKFSLKKYRQRHIDMYQQQRTETETDRQIKKINKIKNALVTY